MKRLDSALVEWGIAPSRTKAQAMVQAGEIELQISGQWRVADDNNFDVSRLSRDDVRLSDDAQTLKYVSRGGLKLECAMEHLKLNPAGWRCLDIGQSTGGFSDYLLHAGAKAILGIDVGHGQLHRKLALVPRVISLEKLDVRNLQQNEEARRWLEQGVDFAVMDLSFISLTLAFPAVAAILPSGTRLLALVKPQFESGPRTVTPDLFNDVQSRVLHAADKYGFSSIEYFSSAVKGQDGNQEFFLLCRRC